MHEYEERIKTMKKARKLGRCLCSLPHKPFKCPCNYFKRFNICKCSGEEINILDTQEDWAEFNLDNEK